MELKAGIKFTGNQHCFTGIVEVLEIKESINLLRVKLTLERKVFRSTWEEDWNLQHTIWGFERGDYFVLQQPINADCNHNQFCDQQTKDMKCKSKSGCNFKEC